MPMARDTAVLAEGLSKSFGKTQALNGVDLAVRPGSICGLLGPNGAGKTTTVRILTTLLRPDAGHARIAGFDVARQPDEVRRRIGLAGQYAAVDELLTGRENLEMVGRLYHLSAQDARRRADELLSRFELEEAANRLAKTYSGGMRRRLDLAASLAVAPQVLFLDEPTTGLDPHNRNVMWALLRELVAGGTTLLLTTQYLEEADQLADQIVVIDTGRVVAAGSPDELKSRVGGEQIDVVVHDAALLQQAVDLVRRVGGAEPTVDVDARRITLAVSTGASALVGVVRDLDAAAIAVEGISLRRPTLDEVFLSLTRSPAQAVSSTSQGATR
jgi:ABC-2 type transport system ATP-binding protein